VIGKGERFKAMRDASRAQSAFGRRVHLTWVKAPRLMTTTNAEALGTSRHDGEAQALEPAWLLHHRPGAIRAGFSS
jgi:hypothetical protein